MKKLWTSIRHNPGAVAGLFLSLVILSWMYGCDSRVRSLKQPHHLVNRSELKLELDTILSEMEMKITDLNKQDAFKQALFAFGTRLAQGQPVDPIGLALVLGNILGIGFFADNIRKGTVIKVLKNNDPRVHDRKKAKT